MVDVAVGKHAQRAWVCGGAAGVGICAVVVIDIQLVLAFDLEHALRGTRAEESEVIGAGVEHKLNAVVGALHGGKGEVRDQAAGDARLNDPLK